MASKQTRIILTLGPVCVVLVTWTFGSLCGFKVETGCCSTAPTSTSLTTAKSYPFAWHEGWSAVSSWTWKDVASRAAYCPNRPGRVVLTSETLVCTARCKWYQSDFISAPRAKYAYSLLRPRMPCMSLAASFLGDLWHCRLDLTTRGRRWMVGKELCLWCGLKSLPLLETDWIYDISSMYRLCTTFWAFWMILHPYFLHLRSLVLCWSMKTFIQDSPATFR